VTVLVVRQPVLIVYDNVITPAVIPVAVPDVDPIDAADALLLIHVPPVVVLE
jgi:hypothetical protein